MPDSANLRARESSFTGETFDIAIHMATKIVALPGFAQRSAIDIAYLIEKELDRYIQEGAIVMVARENHR
jgi:hypothetical protein